ncbi:SRPBCC family protein [Streptomyces sp. NPDC048332]|uniref:SRPBCC family protein n=1 Tax=Streptomyces sp. NPDC048332 TaxID=3154619 RepID=UPI003425C1EC
MSVTEHNIGRDGETTLNSLFQAQAAVRISTSPQEIYRVISDLGRSGDWSPECLGGEWVSGAPGAVGSVFRGENLRSEEVVAWAPVVRGTWFTESEVVAAEPGRTFSWAMRDSAGRKQQSVWGFDIEPLGSDIVLTHRFRMGAPTEGIGGITSGMTSEERRRFVREWGDKIEKDLKATVARIKEAVEGG